jgi:hypothetical protein
MGLVELVEAARERALGRKRIARWYAESYNPDSAFDLSEGALDGAMSLAEEACRLCLCGQFAWAATLASDLWDEESPWLGLSWLFECPYWLAFSEALHLAERIDSFLAVLESDRRTYGLARESRGDLDLLGVLADLCQDSGLSHAAAEGRHLHALACSLSQGVPLPDSDGEASEEDDEDEEEYSEEDWE